MTEGPYDFGTGLRFHSSTPGSFQPGCRGLRTCPVFLRDERSTGCDPGQRVFQDLGVSVVFGRRGPPLLTPLEWEVPRTYPGPTPVFPTSTGENPSILVYTRIFLLPRTLPTPRLRPRGVRPPGQSEGGGSVLSGPRESAGPTDRPLCSGYLDPTSHDHRVTSVLPVTNITTVSDL